MTTFKRYRPAAFTILLCAAVVQSTPAQAESCTYSVPDLAASGDAFYGSWDWCRNDWIAYYWDGYDFDQDDWDGGVGYEDPCNVNLALARTFNAIIALHYSSPNPATTSGDMTGNILRYGGNATLNWIDELDARCGDGSAYAETQSSFWAVDHYTNLFLRFFYNATVVERAGTLIHEAWHADGRDHNASGCVYGDECDSDWNYFGAWKAQILWLWWFYVEGVNTTSAMKDMAKYRGNQFINDSFVNHPPPEIRIQ